MELETDRPARRVEEGTPRSRWLWWVFPALALILLLGAFLRFYGLDWDEGTHLHPDERFLTMVVTSLRWPGSLAEYLDESASPLNPRNAGHSFFPYGTLPTTLVRGLAELLGQADYGSVPLLGRRLSAIFDVLSILLLFLLGRRLFNDDRIAVLAAFFHAAAVLPIQHSHFFVVESFSTFFVLLTLYCLAGAQRSGRALDWCMSGAALGLALACKISSLPLVVVIFLVGVVAWVVRSSDSSNRLDPFWGVLAAGMVALVTFRVAQPDAFQSGILFWPSERWVSNFREVLRLTSGEVDFPPGHQWANRLAYWFPLQNLVVWGLGIPLGLTALGGWAWGSFRLLKGDLRLLIPASWIGLVIGLQGWAWVNTARYLLPAYPALALLAAWGLLRLFGRNRADHPSPDVSRPTKGWAAAALVAVVCLGTLLWALSFVSIYSRPHTRVEASRWIYEHLPRGSSLGFETWDDSLPLPVDGLNPAAEYQFVQMAWFDEDSPQKLEQALQWLDAADALVLSSNRVYDSVSRIPVRYPLTIAYYNALKDGSLGWKRVAEFTSYPGLFGLQFPDQGAEEAFSVYDHPRVQIFVKTDAYSRIRAQEILGRIDWDAVVPLSAKQFTLAPDLLLFSPQLWKAYREGFRWPDVFDVGGLGDRYPWLGWMLALELLHWLTLPIVLAIAGSLPDAGAGLSRTIGWLLVSWLVWLLASLRILSSGVYSVILALCVLGLLSLLLLIRNWESLRRRFVECIPGWLAVHAVFWVCFLAFLAVRAGNPDLWHPFRGGEKPMDFAFMNATLRSPYFPPYDPWFAGGFINYYYFGFVMVASLTKLTGVAPEVAYNLALASFFALFSSAIFTVSAGLVAGPGKTGWRRPLGLGVLGTGLIAVMGNLGTLRVVSDSLAALSRTRFESSFGWLESGIRSVDGLVQWLKGGSIQIPWDAWYWIPTRIISHPPEEAGPINEFPWFTFLFGDLHAHAMALPLVISILAVLLAGTHDGLKRPTWDDLRFLLTALLFGSVWVTNTWDVPVVVLLILAGMLLQWQVRGRVENWHRPLGRWILCAGLGYGLFLPFHAWYRGGFGSFSLWTGSRTPVVDFLMIFGLFLFLLVSAIVLEFKTARGKGPLFRLVRVMVVFWDRIPRLVGQLFRFRLPRPLATGFWFSILGIVGAFVLAGFGLVLPGVLLLLFTIGVVLLVSAPECALRQWTYLFLALGSAVGFGVEIVVLQGDVGRMNTVFKFYSQVWWLWGLAAVGSLALLSGSWASKRTARAFWTGALLVLVSIGAAYPVLSTWARWNDRFSGVQNVGLNGLDFMDVAVYRVDEQDMPLVWDRLAADWIRQNVAGNPVLLEANTFPRLYAWGNRYAMLTGLPAVVGWHWHEQQQRAVLPARLIFDRVEEVREIYTTQDIDRALQLLGRYEVEYIVVGPLEKIYYPGEGLTKFSSMTDRGIELVYSNPGVEIYRLARPAG